MKNVIIKVLILTLVATLCFGALVGCGDKGKGDNSGESETGTELQTGNSTETPTETPTESTTEKATEAPTENPTEQTTTEVPTEAPTEEITNELEFKLNEKTDTYAVTGIGSYTDTDVVIPSTYNSKAVTSIGNSAFYNCKSLTKLTIPDSAEIHNLHPTNNYGVLC